MDHLFNELPKTESYLDDLITVGQNVLEQDPIVTELERSLGKEFPLLRAEDQQTRSQAYSTVWKIMSHVGEWMISIPGKNNELNLMSPENLIKLVEMKKMSHEERVLFASTQLLNRHLGNNKVFENQEDLLSRAPKYLDTLIDPLVFKSAGKRRTSLILKMHESIIISIAEFISTENHKFLPLYARYTNQSRGKTLSLAGNMMKHFVNEVSNSRVMSYDFWKISILKKANESDLPNAIMLGADNLGYATNYSSKGSVREYFIQRGLIKGGE